jgi:hypothetical protein
VAGFQLYHSVSLMVLAKVMFQLGSVRELCFFKEFLFFKGKLIYFPLKNRNPSKKNEVFKLALNVGFQLVLVRVSVQQLFNLVSSFSLFPASIVSCLRSVSVLLQSGRGAGGNGKNQ